jgi:hypothetical protein
MDRKGHGAHDAGAVRRRAADEPDLVLGLDGRALLVPAHAVTGPTLSGDPFPSWVGLAEVSFLVVDLTELSTEPRVRAFTRELPVVERTGDYAISDVRGSRTVKAERRSRMTG